MKFYRYDYHNTAEIDRWGDLTSPRFPNANIYLHEYDLIKETPKGYWIGWRIPSNEKFKWISKTSKKKYAYPTKEEALENLRLRTEVRKKILEWDLRTVDRVLGLIKKYEIK